MNVNFFYLMSLLLYFKWTSCQNANYKYSNRFKNKKLEEREKTFMKNDVPKLYDKLNESPEYSKEIQFHKYKETVKHFYLFTRDYYNGQKHEDLDPLNISTINNSHFIKEQSTFIIIHGFLGHGLEKWILNLKDKLLQKENCNVISVDWPAGSVFQVFSYISASNKVPSIGNDTALLLEKLMDQKGLLLDYVHCIGHSLGAHACGFSGKPFLGRMGRISGLDPAGPRYHNLNSSSRLDKSDALYVDVIHTNACNKSVIEMNCFGLDENIGHSNFFPNGGRKQPACAWEQEGTSGSVGCSHEMAYIYYTYSLDYIRSTNYFLARPCDDWLQYKNGNCSCGKNPQFMGFNVNTDLRGSFYLDTLDHPPYAKQDDGCSFYPSSKIWNMVDDFQNLILRLCILFVLIIAATNIKRICCSSKGEEEYLLLTSNNGPEKKRRTFEGCKDRNL